MPKECSHTDTRLTCTECSMPICSNCLVQCPVGFRCKSCVNPKSAKKEEGVAAVTAKAFAASAFVGLVAGWTMPFITIPYISCIIVFFMGIYSGRWLTKFLDRRIGSKTGVTVVFGVLLGMSLGPLAMIPLSILNLLAAPLTHHSVTFIDSMGGILSLVFDPVCFFAGILRPTLWGDF